MPHSPRWYRDKLWVLNSGRGELGYVDYDVQVIPAVLVPRWVFKLKKLLS